MEAVIPEGSSGPAPCAGVSEAPSAARVATPRRRLLTHSSMEAWNRCESEYRWAYVERVVPVGYPAALAVGTAVHAGIETLHLGLPLLDALSRGAAALNGYFDRARSSVSGNAIDELGRQVQFDAARVRAMLTSWAEQYLETPGEGAPSVDRDIDVVMTERVLEAPLVNPLSKRPSRTFMLAGRVDAIARRRTGVGAGCHVVEFKTTGADLDEFVEAMRHSAQPAIYRALADVGLGDSLGPIAGTVLDIVRKPVIRPRKDETPEAFGARALEEYRAEPSRFFRRVVLPVDEQLQREAMVNAWRIADGIRRAEKYGYISKRGPACRGAYGVCRYRPICWFGDATGFTAKEVEHEELADQE